MSRLYNASMENKSVAVSKKKCTFATRNNMCNFNNFSDKDWVNHLIKNDAEAIVSFFYEKHLCLLTYNLRKVFSYQVDIIEYVNEFFLYLEENNWKRLKTFKEECSSLTTWLSVVSYRFFQKYKMAVIDSRGHIAIYDKWDPKIDNVVYQSDLTQKKDIQKAINQIKNERDRAIAHQIFLVDLPPNEIASQHHITIDYLYTIKNRIIKTLRLFLADYHNEK